MRWRSCWERSKDGGASGWTPIIRRRTRRKRALPTGLRSPNEALVKKSILVVAHDEMLRNTRSAMLLRAGYSVAVASNGDDAMVLMATNPYDLVVVGRNSIGTQKGLDERLREVYPKQLIVKIAQSGEMGSEFVSKVTNSEPKKVLAAVKEVFRESAGA
jgi:DNA-binding response OmpR family regulator